MGFCSIKVIEHFELRNRILIIKFPKIRTHLNMEIFFLKDKELHVLASSRSHMTWKELSLIPNWLVSDTCCVFKLVDVL